MHKPEKILLLPICGLGDAVCYIPFVRSLRKEFPGSEIVAIVATDSAKAIIVGNSPDIEVIVFNRCQQPGWMSPLRLLRKLRRRRFDLVISGAHLNSIRVPLLAYLCCRKTRVGAKSERLSFLYNRTVNVPTNAHAFERFRQLLTAVGIHMSFQEYSPTIEPSSESRDSAMQLWKSAGLDNSECIVGMASGADLNNRGRWLPSLKRWPVERYAEVAKYAAITCQARIVVFGTSEEAPLASAIAESSGVPIVNLCGKTRLPELQWLLRQCNAFVSNDTGTMHLATALGTPVVALFGPTSRESFGPLTTQSRTIQGEAPCSPCYPYPTCTLKGCLAMEDISSHEVIAALSSILTTQKSATLFPIESLGLAGSRVTNERSLLCERK